MEVSLIQDEDEAIRWFNEGRTYAWMCQEYERQYNLSTVPSLWANFRRQRQLSRRIVVDGHLIPWMVKDEHRWAHPLAVLRLVARERAGYELTADNRARVLSWYARLAVDDLVVGYDDDTDEGFFYVPRRPGLDLDLIREPDPKPTTRREDD